MFVPAAQLPSLDVDHAAGRWFIFNDRQQLVLDDGSIPVGSETPVATGRAHLLGMDGSTPFWAANVAEGTNLGFDFDTLDLRSAYGVLPDQDWVMGGRALQVLNWNRDHQFCGRCGTATEDHASDRAKVCPACSLMSFPRLSPAVIMLVERETDSGPEVLLAWGRQFPGRFFSALAGFVEPGESLEECVAREVREEVGIEVDDITYFASQPWPFPHSLMIGFRARYRSGEITIQEEEIVEAGWFSPNELPPAPRGGMSIAGWLIEDWLNALP